MEKINILIIEDTVEEAQNLVKTLERHNYTIVGIAKTFKEAVSLYNNKSFDIAIIDIFLNGLPEGIAFAELMSSAEGSPKPFVFLTSSNDRNLFERAKLTRPYSYLIKPFNELEITYAIEMALEKFYEQQDVFLGQEEDTIISKEHLFIKKGPSLKKVLISDIIYIEVEEKYCNIITSSEKFVIMISLTKILKLLDSTIFFRTHRNFIVNTHKIEEIVPSDNLILLTGNHKVTLSETYKNILKKIRTLR
jgi:DNA-binding LytR/AlgR family response regulator